MTTEERLQKIEENLLVQSHLVATFERGTERALALHRERLELHDQEMAEFRSVVARVLELLERFITGRPGGDGQGPRG